MLLVPDEQQLLSLFLRCDGKGYKEGNWCISQRQVSKGGAINKTVGITIGFFI